jgi:hypothetical protein
LITSPRLDLGFLVRIRRKFFDLLCYETHQDVFRKSGERCQTEYSEGTAVARLWFGTRRVLPREGGGHV